MRKYFIFMLVCTIIFMPIYVEANIECNDGTISKSCVDCHRGCCSHHGGCLKESSGKSSKKNDSEAPVFSDGSSEKANNNFINENETNTVNSNTSKISSNNKISNEAEKNDDTRYGILGILTLLGGIGYYQMTKNKKI